MNSQQRKLIYLIGIVVLFVPIVALGLPATSGASGSSSGGLLYRMKVDYELEEHSLGDVDPSSASLNLVLLGMRGLATDLLWTQALEQQKMKNWAGLRSTVNSITLLQPHFQKVWQFQGWNLAYNVSVEWDLVADRYFWVKEGIKFLKKGVVWNRKFPEIYWYVGDTYGKKVGRADEWVQFRRFFKNDPNKDRFPSGLDPEINPGGEDNYLVAKSWFNQANDVELSGHAQHIMARVLFRSYPARAQLDYAGTLQKEGQFDEITRTAWELGYKNWVEEYGRELFPSDIENIGEIRLENTPEEMAVILAGDKFKNPDGSQKRKEVSFWINHYQDMTNYRYWKTRALAEKDETTTEAHRLIYLGERERNKGNPAEGRKLLEEGMTLYEKVLERYPSLALDDLSIEEGLVAQLNWRACLKLEEEPIPDEYPLKKLWTEKQDRIPGAETEFRRRNASMRR